MLNPSPLLNSLPFTHQVVLAALTCERMIPAIVRFDETEAEPGAPLFRTIVAALYSFGANEPVGMDTFANLQQQLEAFWPDLDESTNPLASYAFDACIAFSEALALVQNGEFEHLLNSATAAQDTVDMYVQDVTNVDLAREELNAFLEAAPLMQQEVARQTAMANILAAKSDLTAAFIGQLRQQSGQEPLIDFALI